MNLEPRDIVQMFRTLMGTCILITSMVTGVDGQMIIIAIALLGVPFELVGRTKK